MTDFNLSANLFLFCEVYFCLFFFSWYLVVITIFTSDSVHTIAFLYYNCIIIVVFIIITMVMTITSTNIINSSCQTVENDLN